MVKKRTILVFFISLSLTFLMSFIPHLTPKKAWVNPQPKRPDIIDHIKPKLENIPNKFDLKKPIIPLAHAATEHDQASAYSVVDLGSGEIIASKNLSQKMPMASLTKIMTATVALDLARPATQIIVSERAAKQIPTKVMLKPGEKYTLSELLYSLMLSSANDSAQAIADGIDAQYGKPVFVIAMNLKAKFLGLKNTSFTNAQGFDNPNHYSSVEDLSILSAYALKNYPFFSQIVSKQYEDLTDGGRDLRFYLNNWNGLLGVYPGVNGIKIGNTPDAGFCTTVSAERNGKKVLAVVLGAPGVLERDLWASQLLDLGFEKVANLEPVNITEEDLRAKYASWKYFE